jgi:hypothetical protein
MLAASGADLGRNVGVRDDGRSAFVLAKFGKDAMREGEGQIQPLQCGGDLPFVVRIGESEQSGDGDGFDAGVIDGFDEGFELDGVNGEDQITIGSDALSDTEAEVGRDEALRRALEPIVELGACLAADGEGVFKTFRGDEGDACALTLEHRVGGDGRAVSNDDAGAGSDCA